MNRYLAASLLLFTIASAHAAEDVSELNPVIVTATRTAQTADASLAPVTVITRADIERLQPRSVQELLTGLPGVSIANNGGNGKLTSVFMRGDSAQQLLVLIDGIKVGSATAGMTALEQIPVDQIDRIEIVRGPRSSLYGSEAVGGVIQIFTRKDVRTLTPSFSVGGGTYNTWQGQGGLSGSVGKAWYSTSVSGFYTDGINSCRGVGAPTFSGGCFTDEPDKDGYWNTSGSVRGGYRFDNGAELSADWLRVYGHTYYDGSFQNNSRQVQQVLGGTLRLPQWGVWQPVITLGQSEDQSYDYENDTFVEATETQRNTASWQNDFVFAPRQQLTAGADYLDDHVGGTTAYTSTSREDIGSFVQYQGGFGHNDVQLSARGDHNQQFGNHYTGSGAWSYSFGAPLRITASYGTAFRAPSFNELYFPPDPFGDLPNPNLRPEKSYNGELGFSGRPGFWDWSVNAYQTNINNLITFSFPQPVNVQHARIRGVEAQIGALWNGWRGQLYATYLDPRNRTGNGDNHLLPRRAQQTARLDIDRDIHRFSIGTTLNASGRRFNDLANTAQNGGYATVDLRGGYQFTQSWLLQVQLSNLLDKHYETVQYFNQPGRAVFFTLRYHPARP